MNDDEFNELLKDDEYRELIRLVTNASLGLAKIGVPAEVAVQIMFVDLINPKCLEPGGIDRILKARLTDEQYIKAIGLDEFNFN